MLEPTLPFLFISLPFCLYAGWSDLRTMTIPNFLSIGLIMAFLLAASIFMPFETMLWRLLSGVVVLVIGFILNAVGVLGGGDAKLAAAMAPFVAYQDISAFMFILSVSLLATLGLHRLAMRVGPLRRATPDWASWHAGRYFPMGVSLATALIVYLLWRMINVG